MTTKVTKMELKIDKNCFIILKIVMSIVVTSSRLKQQVLMISMLPLVFFFNIPERLA
jgi:hypothetical protein